MSNDVWRWADPDGQQRRVRLDELRAALAGGHIAPNTPVWKPGWASWQSAHEVPELTSASLGGAHGVVLNIPPPPLAMVAVQQDYEKRSESMAPVPASVAPASPEPEPPPPPRYVPVPAKMPSIHPPSSQNIPTQIGGSPAFAAAPAPMAPMPAPAPPVQSIPTTIGMPAPAFPAPHSGIEELSGSLLESGSSPDLSHLAAPPGAPPSSARLPFGRRNAPTERRASPPLDGPLFLHDPPPNVVDRLVADIKALRAGEAPKNKPLLIGAGVLSLLVVLGLFGTIIGLASGGSASAKTTPSASASARASAAPPPEVSSSPVVTTTVSAPPPPAPPPSSPVLGDCTVAGDPKLIAPRAVSGAAIEGQALGSALGIGFAASSHDAVATMLDAASLAPMSTVRTKPPGGDVRRVTPFLNGTKLAAFADVDRKGDRLAMRRSVATSPPVDVGIADGQVVWAPRGKDSSARLFALDGEATPEALRAIPLADRRGVALTFRHGSNIRVGVARGEGVLEPDGDLSKIEGLGQERGTLGSPSLTSTGDRVVVAWADRASTGEQWSIRWTSVKPHGAADEATPFTVPDGGQGDNAMSPSVASLGGGRFLLAWTEGSATSHQVRALTFGADGSPSGAPLTISGANDNAGQPAIALNADGRGVVAFLSAKGRNSFEVHVTPITCPRQP
ncbi:MAG: DUF4339 domain-containing protein [Labilithrix sp.]|nr:DUF4339 domain-containing protein [Labilithrix sp.]MCW5810560.1 DUF4339 domain-containing protein [Labilithrix sp.]